MNLKQKINVILLWFYNKLKLNQVELYLIFILDSGVI